MYQKLTKSYIKKHEEIIIFCKKKNSKKLIDYLKSHGINKNKLSYGDYSKFLKSLEGSYYSVYNFVYFTLTIDDVGDIVYSITVTIDDKEIYEKNSNKEIIDFQKMERVEKLKHIL